MASHSSILAWRIPWTEEPGRLHSMGLQSRTQLKRLSTHDSSRPKDREVLPPRSVPDCRKGSLGMAGASLSRWRAPRPLPKGALVCRQGGGRGYSAGIP